MRSVCGGSSLAINTPPTISNYALSDVTSATLPAVTLPRLNTAALPFALSVVHHKLVSRPSKSVRLRSAQSDPGLLSYVVHHIEVTPDLYSNDSVSLFLAKLTFCLAYDNKYSHIVTRMNQPDTTGQLSLPSQLRLNSVIVKRSNTFLHVA